MKIEPNMLCLIVGDDPRAGYIGRTAVMQCLTQLARFGVPFETLRECYSSAGLPRSEVGCNFPSCNATTCTSWCQDMERLRAESAS